jgi:TM2 domain-containing membrane protein YozV
MYCRHCGKEVNVQAVSCPACGVPPALEKKFCQNCAAPTQPNQSVCTKCGVALAVKTAGGDSKQKLVAGLLGILLGAIGIHKFYLGYSKEGVIMVLVSVLTCGLAAGIMSVIGIIEGIMYLTKSDEEFEQIYVRGRKGWF